MNEDAAAAWLDREWAAALEDEAAPAADPETDRLVDSDVVSIRYAVVTQLLGKAADPARDLLCLQRGAAEDAEAAGRWDRSRIADEWARGANVYRVTIAELARSAFALLDEGRRVRFARSVGAELERRAAGYRHRRAWADLLAQA